MKILTIIGARPQIIKAAAVSRAIRKHFSDQVDEVILHTGQHYDNMMSEVFFNEMGIPSPNYNLGVGSVDHNTQTERMIEGISNVLQQERPNGVIVYGDTNSTLAGAMAAHQLEIPLFHIEAGLRSYNNEMPEEHNRIVADRLSNICFAPTQTAVDNLMSEGCTDHLANNRIRKVVFCGDVMLDNTLYYSSLAAQKCDIIKRLSLKTNNYILATIHRNYNTDDNQRLSTLLLTLSSLATNRHMRIILPLHPRTRKMMQSFLPESTYHALLRSRRLMFIRPVSYLNMLELERNAQIVMTDSGGVQKEAFFLERPCIILRPETEWTEIVDHQAGILADADADRIVKAYDTLCNREIHFPPLFGDGHAAEHIVNEIINYFK